MKINHKLYLCIAVLNLNFATQAADRFNTERQKALSTNPAGNSFITVGADIACDYQIGVNTLQDAINTGATEIRLATNTSFAPVSFTGSDTVRNLIGGYADCTDAINDQLSINQSIITGLLTEDILSVHDVSLNIANVQLTDGNNGLLITNNSLTDLVLENVTANFNQKGIDINTANLSLFAHNIKLHHNVSTSGSGGGLGCVGQASITIAGNSGIYSNQSSLGGGVFLQGCQLLMIGGNHSDNTVGIRNNTATQIGGGVAVVGANSEFIGTGSTLMINGIQYGDNTGPLMIFSNHANGVSNGFGGGLFIEGIGSKIKLSAVSLIANTGLRGGGIYASFNSQLTISRPEYGCWSDINCNYIGLNETLQAGGGIFAHASSQLQMSHTRLSRNRASRGIAALVSGTNTQVSVQSVFIDQNGDNGQNGFADQTVITVENEAKLDGYFLTVVENASVAEVFKSDNSSLNLHASYLYNPNGGPFLTEVGNVTTNTSCLILDDTHNMASSGTLMSNTDFLNTFQNTATGDYRIIPGALGMDFCSQPTIATGLLSDINNNQRGYDDPEVINHNNDPAHVFDVGVHENLSSDIIFQHGFDPDVITDMIQ